MSETPQRRRRHLMDPNAPRPVHDYAAENASLTQVQRWVMSVLAVSTIFHLVVGVLLGALLLDNPRPGAQLGLCIIAGVLGMIAVGLGFLIHQEKPWTPWLLAGLLPSVIGAWFIFG